MSAKTNGVTIRGAYSVIAVAIDITPNIDYAARLAMVRR